MVKPNPYLIASLLIHLAIFAYLVPVKGCSSDPDSDQSLHKMQKDNNLSTVNVEIKEIEHKDDVKLSTPPRKDSELQPAPAKKNECEKWFGGIGVTITFQNDSGTEILKVHDGYPAKAAGLMAGDVIVWVSDRDIRGEPGTPVTIRVMRSNNLMSFEVVRGKICY